LHPFRTAGEFEGPDADAPFTVTGSYTEPRSLLTIEERDGIRMPFHDAHRPLSFYAQALERAGFMIEAMREPLPEGAFAGRPGVAKHARIPLYLHVRAVKPG
jgi:hypothetical protein